MKKFIGLLSSMCFFSQISLAHPDADQVRKSFTAAGVYSLQKEKSSQESPDLVALGRHLFFEKQLSGNKNISCATCHHPRFGTGDALPVSLGTGGTDIGPNRQKNSGHLIPRNAPPAFNLGFNSFHTTMWDGRIAKDAKTGALKTPDANLNGINPEAKEIAQQLTTVAAAQAMFPVTSAHEMRGDAGENEIADASTNLEAWKNLVIRLLGKNNGTVGGITKYKKMFQQAYPEVKNLDQINYGHVARAVAAYENFAFLADNSNFDKFLLGNDQALTSAQLRGAKLFVGKAQCITCHSGPHLTDFQFHSLGAPQLGLGKGQENGEPQGEDRGLALLTGKAGDNYKFKTPTLRNVALTGPWTHSGSVQTLEDVILLHAQPVLFCETYRKNPKNFFYTEFYENFVSTIDADTDRFASRMNSVSPELNQLGLSQSEVQDLVLFLKSLTDKKFLSRAKAPTGDEL